jgi:hypothetical protein
VMFAILSNDSSSTITEGETTEHDTITSILEMASCILCLPHM